MVRIAYNAWKEAQRREEEAETTLLDALNAWAGRAFGRDTEASFLTIGVHECADSPIDRCVYDEEEDLCCDHCLVCGMPEERK